MTEQQLRQKVVDTFTSYLGAKKGSAKHKELIDIYNSYLPHPEGYKVTYQDNWCAASASAIGIKLSLTDIIPVECSCSRQIALWKKLGRWIEDESTTPKKGDFVYYVWSDGKDYAKTDNQDAPNHVGIVVSVEGNVFRVIEGNKGTESIVDYRDMAVNGRYLRGFASPDYAKKAKSQTQPAIKKKALVQLPVLSKGICHQSVKILQAALIESGFPCGGVDGDFGDKTEEAVKKFQKDAGLPVNGEVGASVWKRIFGL